MHASTPTDLAEMPGAAETDEGGEPSVSESLPSPSPPLVLPLRSRDRPPPPPPGGFRSVGPCTRKHARPRRDQPLQE